MKRTRKYPDRVSDDERLMGTFFYKVAVLVLGLLAFLALLVYAVVRLVF